MNSGGFPAKDSMITILAVWLAATLAGYIRFLPLPNLVESLLSLAAYLVLLLIYAIATGPGRRSGAAFYLAGAFLYPIYFLAVMSALSSLTSLVDSGGHSALTILVFSLLGAGSAFGFQLSGGPDTPGEAYLGPWLINAIAPVLIALAVRGYVRWRVSRTSVG
jgi:hypothetical protein